jgi:hypothetical protein
LGGTAGNRTVTITPAAGQIGTSLITVTVTDGGGLSTNTAFLLVVRPSNNAPTLDSIGDLVLNQGAGSRVVNLTGIGSGAADETQTLVVAASSSNPAVIPAPVVTYASPAATGSLLVTPVSGTNGSATITVTVNDGAVTNHTVTRTFTVTVRGGPRLAELPEQILDEDTVSKPHCRHHRGHRDVAERSHPQCRLQRYQPRRVHESRLGRQRNRAHPDDPSFDQPVWSRYHRRDGHRWGWIKFDPKLRAYGKPGE